MKILEDNCKTARYKKLRHNCKTVRYKKFNIDVGDITKEEDFSFMWPGEHRYEKRALVECVCRRQIINMNLLLFLMLFLYTVSLTTSMKCDDVQFDTTCNDNCSQPARFPGANDTFFCKIRLQEGLKFFQEENRKLLGNVTIVIDAPKLTSVDWYLKPYLVNNETRWNPSLNISYQLPDGFFALVPKTRREYLLKGVLLNFTSVADLSAQDVYYHDCPKYSLFNFSAYSPTYFDSEKPRMIKYDCLVGLDENDLRVYMIGLQSLPGTGITYYVTTYNQRQVWKPTIATAFRNATALHVVFEQAPFNVNSYQVELFQSEGNSLKPKNRTPVQMIIKLPTDNSHSFEVLKGGYYFVQVSVLGNHSECPDKCLSKSWIIYTSSLAFSTAENDSWLDENHGILAAIVGCLAGIFLVMLLFYMLWKKRVNIDSRSAGRRKPSVFIVYSYECSEFDSLVQSFAKYIQDKWDINVHLDIWEETQSQGISVSWCSEKLRSVDFLLCICSRGWIETFNGNRLSSHRQYDEYFKYAIDEVNRMRDRSDHCPEILTIYFDFMAYPVPIALKSHRSYMLMQSSKKLFCHLHNCKNVPRKFNRAVDGLGVELHGEINKVKLFFDTHPNWIERRIINQSVIQEQNDKMFSFAKPPSSRKSEKKLNPEMNRGKLSQSENEYEDLEKELKELNQDPDEKVSGSDLDLLLNNLDNKADLAIDGEYKNMESPSARPLIHPNNLGYNDNNVKTHQHSHHCRLYSPDHNQELRNNKLTVSKKHASFLPDEMQTRTSQPRDFKQNIHYDNNLMNRNRNHSPASPPHAHHKVYPPSLPLRLPAPQHNGKKMSCSHPFSSQPDESALFGDTDPRHSHESKFYPHLHREVSTDEYPSLGQSLTRESWQPQTLVNYEENIVPPLRNYVDKRLSSPVQISCSKHNNVRDSATGKPFIDHADSKHDQNSFHGMHFNSPQKSWLHPRFADRPKNPCNSHRSSHFAHQIPVQLDRPFMFNQPHSIEISGLSGERYPLHPESDTSYFPNDEDDREHFFDESQRSMNNKQIYKQKHTPLLSDTLSSNKFLCESSHVSHPQNNINDKNMLSNSYQEESEHLLMQSDLSDTLLDTHSKLNSFPYLSNTFLDTHFRLKSYAETENQSSNEYQINLQHEGIDEEFVPPEDLSGSEGEFEKSKPMSESMESVMEELAGLNETDSFEMENDPIERPSSVI
ncbi:hypothetical protein CHS0354_038507 [Potamilus streckersoni]|uniref:SEFIR domain-containing protein n=1 Tax=Potamilus streckersoni TaxID=2493646 RepID=A0AAE0S655_9BIVA|nr:hypothetical protein CHS0354_038507 [Potamilus streckersoni]